MKKISHIEYGPDGSVPVRKDGQSRPMKKFITNCAIIFSLFIASGLVGGFLNGAGIATSEDAGIRIFAFTLLATMAGFGIAVCRVPAPRLKHLCWLAAFFWLINGLFCIAMNLPDSTSSDPGRLNEWLTGFVLPKLMLENLIFTIVCAGIGGIFSMAIMEHLDKQKGTTT